MNTNEPRLRQKQLTVYEDFYIIYIHPPASQQELFDVTWDNLLFHHPDLRRNDTVPGSWCCSSMSSLDMMT